MHADTLEDLETRLPDIRRSPSDEGRVELIARRPAAGEREVIEEGTLDLDQGLVGDSWSLRNSQRLPDGSVDRAAQLTLMNSRVAALLAGAPNGWAIAGDQLYVDLDLSIENLPPGTRLRIGTALVEVSAVPHTGCSAFRDRFGIEALRFVSTPVGKQLRLRGMNTRIIEGGTIRTGDTITKIEA